MFALLHSKRHVRSERKRLNKLEEEEDRETEFNYESCMSAKGYIKRTEVAGAVFGAEQQLLAFQLKEMFTTEGATC